MTRLFAYIDPGTGSVIVQAVIGAVAGTLYVAKRRIRSIISKFRPETATEESSRD